MPQERLLNVAAARLIMLVQYGLWVHLEGRVLANAACHIAALRPIYVPLTSSAAAAAVLCCGVPSCHHVSSPCTCINTPALESVDQAVGSWTNLPTPS